MMSVPDAARLADRLAALGASIQRHSHPTLGDTVVARFEGGAPGPTLLLIGHADTVFEVGFLARRPFEITGDRVLGPGVNDMRGGLLVGLYAPASLRAPGQRMKVPPQRSQTV